MFKKLLMRVIGSQPSPTGMLPPLPFEDDATIQEAATTEAAERQREKMRIKTIVDSDEAIGRRRLAVYLATDTDLSAAAAISILAASEREGTGAPKDANKPTAKEGNAARCADFFAVHERDNPELWCTTAAPLSVAETIERMNRAYAAATGEKLS